MKNPVKVLFKYLKRIYFNALRSIAFYPVLITSSFLLISIIVLYLENTGVFNNWKQSSSYLFVQDYETARTWLSALIGGILSLTVFSFTMVMLVLNQASANFSPRLLPGLVANKKYQIILGFYIGTLLYCIVVLISLGAYGSKTGSSGLSITLSAVFALLCISMFVYFIDTISKAIQIRNIIEVVSSSCMESIKEFQDDQTGAVIGLKDYDTQGWSEIACITSGYFRGFDTKLLSEEFKDSVNQIEVIPYVGQHLWEGDAIFRTEQNLSADEIENLLFCVYMSSDRHVENDASGGMVQLMEIAVKALSPGINDPGTALDVLSHLGNLMAKHMAFPAMSSSTVENSSLVILRNYITTPELLRIVIQPIRAYGKSDSSIMSELVRVLIFLLRQKGVSPLSKKALETELEALKIDLEENIGNSIDRAYTSTIMNSTYD
ncbi:DUF2254 domain-containing protein [Aggregatimonas sangjinii]|uniref:DUF2254 domain-containing protein n=1 Tax=Aggregatimonas sangjinii TaxID=2583587 RepID=A0A5B7SYI2_9FLAO|nr:DUF2254 domain-containing protein [Aggregatimonas sangjinii]QCX01971.1 DUF2254 domain-containing protein [Aggregatimonas sangjinii]